jgi:hypothetical protein
VGRSLLAAHTGGRVPGVTSQRGQRQAGAGLHRARVPPFHPRYTNSPCSSRMLAWTHALVTHLGSPSPPPASSTVRPTTACQATHRVHWRPGKLHVAIFLGSASLLSASVLSSDLVQWLIGSSVDFLLGLRQHGVFPNHWSGNTACKFSCTGSMIDLAQISDYPRLHSPLLACLETFLRNCPDLDRSFP